MGEKLLQFTQDVQAALFGLSLIAPLKLNNRMHKPTADADVGDEGVTSRHVHKNTHTLHRYLLTVVFGRGAAVAAGQGRDLRGHG